MRPQSWDGRAYGQRMATAPKWDTEELPVLDAVLAEEAAKPAGEPLTSLQVAERAALSHDLVRHVLHRLSGDGYLIVQPEGQWPDAGLWVMNVLGPARRAAGQWPAENAYASLLDLLGEQIDQAADPEERTGLERFRTGVLSAGSQVATGLLLRWAERQAGLG